MVKWSGAASDAQQWVSAEAKSAASLSSSAAALQSGQESLLLLSSYTEHRCCMNLILIFDFD